MRRVSSSPRVLALLRRFRRVLWRRCRRSLVGSISAALLLGVVPSAEAQRSGNARATGAASGSAGAEIPRIPLAQLLTELDTYLTQRRAADAADLLDTLLARVVSGETLPAGLTLERLRVGAATLNLQAGRPARAAGIAEEILATAQPAPTAAALAEARLVLGLALAQQEKFAAAVPVFSALESSPPYRDKARLFLALAAQKADDLDTAVAAYQRLLTDAARDADWADAALSLIHLHLEQGDLDAARRGLALLRGSLDLVDNLTGLAVLSLRLGDALLAGGDPAGALAAYRPVPARAELQREQAARSERMAAQLDRLRALTRSTALDLDAARRLDARLQLAREALADVEAMADWDAALLYRRGNAFLERDSPWEAALLFERVLTAHPAAAERERAWLGLVRATAASARQPAARDALTRFAEEFPQSELGQRAAYAAATAAADAGAPAAAVALVQLGLARFPAGELTELLQLLLAHTQFAAGDPAAARLAATASLAAYPEGRYAEDASYLAAMAALVLGQAADAARELDAYLKTYGAAGRFVADARYRLAAAEFAQEKHAAAATRLETWLAAYALDHPQRGEVLSLQGDVLAAQGDVPAALAAYRAALLVPLADEQLGYVLDEATRLYQLQRDFESAVRMWEEFASEQPDHPFALNAAYWAARLRAREGRHEEALTGLAARLQPHLADPTRENLERLLSLFAQLLVRAARASATPGAVPVSAVGPDAPTSGPANPADPATATAGVTVAEFPLPATAIAKAGGERLPPAIAAAGSATGATGGRAAAPAPRELEARAEALLLTAELRDQPTAQARLFFTRAELAAQRRDPAAAEKTLLQLGTLFAPEALPPGLLGRAADAVRAAGDLDRARLLYTTLLDRHPRSAFADFAYVGLGELALGAGEYTTALAHFDAAIDRAGARFKLLEATLGRARTQLALGRLEVAQPLFEQIAANRAWRGEATAESVFSLGEILARRGGREHLAQAQAHYQRVYVAYRKFVPWVARAYLRSGETFEALQQPAEAAATYREMLRDARLAARPETATARARLAALAPAAGGPS